MMCTEKEEMLKRKFLEGITIFKMHSFFPYMRGIHILLIFLGIFLKGSGNFPSSTS